MPEEIKTPVSGPTDEIEDIFKEVESTESMVSATPTEANKSGKALPSLDEVKPRKNFFRPIIIIVIIAAVGYGIWYSWPKIKDFRINQGQKTEVNAGKIEIETETEAEEEPVTTPEPAPIIPDLDNDGLTDAEENALGTNKNNPDSDGDGLLDKEEVKIYLTNPLNPDSDGDGISDGDEVKLGRDPKNPDADAKLLDLQKGIKGF